MLRSNVELSAKVSVFCSHSPRELCHWANSKGARPAALTLCDLGCGGSEYVMQPLLPVMSPAAPHAVATNSTPQSGYHVCLPVFSHAACPASQQHQVFLFPIFPCIRRIIMTVPLVPHLPG